MAKKWFKIWTLSNQEYLVYGTRDAVSEYAWTLPHLYVAFAELIDQNVPDSALISAIL